METKEFTFIGTDGNKKYFRDEKGDIYTNTREKVSLTDEQISNLQKKVSVPITRKEEVEE